MQISIECNLRLNLKHVTQLFSVLLVVSVSLLHLGDPCDQVTSTD